MKVKFVTHGQGKWGQSYIEYYDIMIIIVVGQLKFALVTLMVPKCPILLTGKTDYLGGAQYNSFGRGMMNMINL